MKKLLKFALIYVVYTMAYVFSHSALPFSQDFLDAAAQNSNPGDMRYIAVSCLWICFTVYYLVSRSQWSGVRTTITITVVMFCVQSFLMQLETLFFYNAFASISKADTVMIMLAGLLPLVISVPLAAKFFCNGNKNRTPSEINIDKRGLAIFIPALGLCYMAIYFTFGYFVAFSLPATRSFYQGTSVDLGFIGQLAHNWSVQPGIYPFQFLRGILFVVSIIPLLHMIQSKGRQFVTAVSMVYFGVAIVLIIPNFLFPDEVRWMHFYEVSSSMLLFGIVTGLVLSKCRKPASQVAVDSK